MVANSLRARVRAEMIEETAHLPREAGDAPAQKRRRPRRRPSNRPREPQ